jgi:uncharacterized protein (TIGR03067 family)
MKRSLILAWALLAALVLPVVAADDKVTAEAKTFEGTWQVIAMEVGGKKIPDEGFGEMTFTFKGKTYEQKSGDTLVEAGKQDLDPSKKPMVMDITVTDGETKGKKQLAIYEWDGADKVKICAADHEDTNRPKKFETAEGSREMLFILKKKK